MARNENGMTEGVLGAGRGFRLLMIADEMSEGSCLVFEAVLEVSRKPSGLVLLLFVFGLFVLASLGKLSFAFFALELLLAQDKAQQALAFEDKAHNEAKATETSPPWCHSSSSSYVLSL